MAKNEYLLGKNEYMRQYRSKNKEKVRVINNRCYKKNRKKYLAQKKQYFQDNKLKIYEQRKNYVPSEQSKENRRSWDRIYTKKPSVMLRRKTYLLKYQRRKYHINNFYKLKINIKNSIMQSIKQKHSKCKWKSIVGYDLHTLKSHIESQFKLGMSWANHGKKWQIDHITPQCKWQKGDISTIKEIWRLDNIRPLIISKHRKKMRYDLEYANRN